MAKVTGIGGVFFKCEDPEDTKKWYRDNLGIEAGEYGHTFWWKEDHKPNNTGCTVWSTFSKDSNYFNPGKQEFMINYRVDNLVELLAQLKRNGIEQEGEMEEFDYGKFAWIMDPDGRKIELWEPVDEKLED